MSFDDFLLIKRNVHFATEPNTYAMDDASVRYTAKPRVQEPIYIEKDVAQSTSVKDTSLAVRVWNAVKSFFLYIFNSFQRGIQYISEQFSPIASLFFRMKQGEVVEARFDWEELFKKDLVQLREEQLIPTKDFAVDETITPSKAMKAFHEFHIVPSSTYNQRPLNIEQQAEALRLLTPVLPPLREVVSRTIDEASRVEEIGIHADRKKQIETKFWNVLCDDIDEVQLLAKSAPKEAKKGLWDRVHWRKFEAININLIKKYVKSLNVLFGTTYLDKIQKNIRDKFGVDYKESLIAQLLSLSLAYNAPQDGDIIPLPTKRPDGSYSLCNYEVSTLILGDNIPYYVLMPQEDAVEPWIVFRGTVAYTKTDAKGELKQGARESINADLAHRDGVGYGLIDKALKDKSVNSLTAKLREIESRGVKCKVTGHSLGGVLSKDFGVKAARYVDQVYTFGAPWVSKETHTLWSKALKQGTKQQKIVNWIIDGDPVGCVGSYPVGTYIVTNPVGARIAGDRYNAHEPAPLELSTSFWHQQNILSGWNFDAQLMDVENEGQKYLRAITEKVRYFAGKVAHLFV